MELNRRTFIKTAGTAAAAAAMTTVAASALADAPAPAEGEGAPQGGPVAGPGMDNPQDSGIVIENWEIRPGGGH